MDGIGFFIQETLQRMVNKHPEDEFYFFFDRKYDPDFIFGENVIPVVLHPQARHPILYTIWFELSVTMALKKIKPDIFLSPDGYLSLLSSTPQLPVIHDINFEHYPQDLPKLEAWYYRYFFPKYAKKAERIATVSEASKKDIASQYHVDPDLIDVVYNGVKDGFHPIDKELKKTLQLKFTKGDPYFIFVGTLLPRKNIVNLFKAFDLFKKKYPSKMKLLLVGNKKWWTDDMKLTYQNLAHQEDVIFSGRVSDEELYTLTAGAEAMTYISYFEGFGVPPLEAYKCHIPAITSNVTSLPEIAGDGALLVDPFNIPEIAEAMNTIVNDTTTREMLIQNAIQRKNEFSWEKSADLLYDSIVKAIEK